MVWPLGVKPLKRMVTSWFLVALNISAKSMATICPNTVAAAAPWMPILGNPIRPKIRMGSRMMLMMAPVPWVIML